MMMNIAAGHGFSLVDTACQDDPDIFFSDEESDISKAKELCSSCPVKDRCLRQATEDEEQFGVWGGELFPLGGKVISTREILKKDDLSKPKECRRKLHIMPAGRENNTCKECKIQHQKKYEASPAGKKSRQKANSRRKKNVMGGTCSSGKHTLSPANTVVRTHDKALMCLDCLQSAARSKFKTDKGIADGYGFSDRS